MNKLWASHKQVMNKLLTSHEQVPIVVIIRLKTGKTIIPGVWCMVVPHNCDNKATSAPSWGLAGWLGRSLAKLEVISSSKNIQAWCDFKPLIWFLANIKNEIIRFLYTPKNWYPTIFVGKWIWKITSCTTGVRGCKFFNKFWTILNNLLYMKPFYLYISVYSVLLS